MIEFVITFALLLGVFIPIFHRELRCDKNRTRANITLFYEGNDCFEPAFLRLIKACDRLSPNITVVDLVSTDESRRWLCHLSEKTDIYFCIISNNK